MTSRLQRDLTDSTTQRNIGSAFGQSLLAIDNLRRGLGSLHVDHELLARDLDANWEVLGEPVQSAMRAATSDARARDRSTQWIGQLSSSALGGLGGTYSG